jgi:hypothetical protein
MTIAVKLQLIAPQFSSLPNLQDYIDLADEQVSAKMCKRDLVVAYLTAHVIEMANRGGSGGSVASESEGGLSRSYNTTERSLLAATSYGAEYLRLVRSCGVGSFTMRTFKA